MTLRRVPGKSLETQLFAVRFLVITVAFFYLDEHDAPQPGGRVARATTR